jgi:hypothetical protein
LILEELMNAVSKRLSIEDPLPCEYFHLIVGSEWGAILAIMLGRLRRVSFITLLIAFVFTKGGRASPSAGSGSKALPTLVEVAFSVFSREYLRGEAITTKNASRS